jgi:hypothetical protein
MYGSDAGPSADLVRDRATDAMRPGNVWIAGINLPAPSASSLMALCLYGSPFVNARGVDLLETELSKHVIIAAYCLAMQSEAIPAATAKDCQIPAEWGDSVLIGIDYIQAARDLMICIGSVNRGFELFSDNSQKKTTTTGKPCRTGGRSMGWLSRLFDPERPRP